MKILVTGGTGIVGSNVIKVAREKYGADVIATLHKRRPQGKIDYTTVTLDITDKEHLNEVLAMYKPDAVIHCAATVDTDQLERDHRMGWDLMVTATREMAEGCKAVGAKLIQVSSDWVFGQTGEVCREDTPPCPVDYYGFLKVVGESVVSSCGVDYGIARIAGLYGVNWAFPDWTPQKEVTGFGTLPNWIYGQLKDGREVVLWTKFMNILANSTLASDCARAMLEIIYQKQSGIFHCCGSQPIGRVELGKLIARTFGFSEDKVRAATEDEMRPEFITTPVPEKTALDVSRTEEILGAKNVAPEEGLREWKRQMKEKTL